MSKTKSKSSKIVCLKCQKEKAQSNSNFYMNTNPLFSTEKLEVCKDCINLFIGEKDSEGYINRVMLVLALLNKPLHSDLWLQRGENWADYIPQLSTLHQYKGLGFSDSNFIDFFYGGSPTITDELDDCEDIEDIEELYKYWGKGYTKEQYSFLEEEKMKLMSSFECPDYGMEMIMRDICFINLDIEKIRSEQRANGSTDISKLIKIRSDLMNDAKMKPIQATGAEANDQLSFGVLIKKWENDKPVPKALDDEMKTYIDTFMVGHLAKMEGLNNELTEKYDQALADYTISLKDINKDDEYEDE